MSDYQDFESALKAEIADLNGLIEDATPAAKPHVQTACEELRRAMERHDEIHGGDADGE